MTDPVHYVWSSYQGNVGLHKDPLLTPHAEYWTLGNTSFERHQAYQHIVAEGLSDNDLALIRKQTHKGWALASEDFVQQVSASASRRMLPKPKGRARHSK